MSISNIDYSIWHDKIDKIKEYMIQRGRLDYFVILTLYDYSYAELNTILDIKLKDIEVTSGKRVYFTPETIIFIPEYEFRLPEEHHKLVVRCLTKLAEGKKTMIIFSLIITEREFHKKTSHYSFLGQKKS